MMTAMNSISVQQRTNGVRRRGLPAMLLAGTALCWFGTAAAQEVLPTVKVVGARGLEATIEATQVLDQAEIDREQPNSLRDLFQNTPAVTTPSASTAAQKFYVHGLDQAKLNVSIDGAPQRNNVWHHNGAMTLDPLFLKGVTVEAGVAPADAGPGALGGAVRFETKDATDMLLPGQTKGGTVILGYDTNSSTWRATGAGYAAKDGFEILGIGTLSEGDNYDNGRGSEERGTTTDLASGLGKLAYEAQSGHRFAASVEQARDEGVRRLRPNMGLVANSTGARFNSNKAVRTTATLSYETTDPTAVYDPEATLYYNRNSLDRPNENNLTTPHGAFNADIVSFGGTLKNTFAIKTGSLTTGVDFNHDDTTVERFHFATNAGEEITMGGLFAQARIAPVERLSLSGGARLDHQMYNSVDDKSFDNTGFSPNMSAEYAITARLTGFAGASYSWAGLEMPETGLFHAANYTYADDLDPTTAKNLRAGLRFTDGGLLLEGALFRTLIDNPLATNDTTRTRINGLDLRTEGVDLTAGYRWEQAQIRGQYTHTDVTYGGRMALPNDYNTAVPVGDLFSVNGSYSFDQLHLTLGASAEFALSISDDALRAAGFGTLDGYQVANLFVEWQPIPAQAHWTLRVEANNLFDEAYSSRSTFAQTAVINPVLAEGRSFYLASTLKF